MRHAALDGLWQGRDSALGPQAVLQIIPKNTPSLRHEFFRLANERVPALLAHVAARACANVALFHVVPDVGLAQVGVQRHFGPPQDEQQLVIVFVQPGELLVQRYKTYLLGERLDELRRQRQRLWRRRRRLVAVALITISQMPVT